MTYPAKKQFAALDYIFNSHPNREAIIGSDWKLEVSDALRSSLKTRSSDNSSQLKTVRLAIESMGFANAENNQELYNVNSQTFLSESNTHLLLDNSPYMFDGTTLKTTPALAFKTLEALGDGSKVIFGD
jgi:hypothetical protein